MLGLSIKLKLRVSVSVSVSVRVSVSISSELLDVRVPGDTGKLSAYLVTGKLSDSDYFYNYNIV